MSTALENFRAAPVHEVELSGTILHYRTFGEGPAVLLLHGWPLSGITYRHLIEALRPHYRCYVPDFPGAGATPWSPRITEMIHGYADLMLEFIDHLQLDRVALIGQDSGGGVARVVAAALPGRVSCIILQNTEVPNYIPPVVHLLKLVAATRPSMAAMRQLMKLEAFRKSTLGFGNCFGNRELIRGEFYEACLRPLESDVTGHMTALKHLDLRWTPELTSIHAKIDAPIHLFWGEKDDDFFPLSRAEAMASQFRQRGEFKVIPGAKLFVHEEAIEELNQFALPLLAKGFANRSQSFDGQRQPLRS